MTLTGEIPPNVTGYRAVDLLWTLADSRRAWREGWDLFPCGYGLSIQYLESVQVFHTDGQALEHCINFAEISSLHARALAIHFHSLATRER